MKKFTVLAILLIGLLALVGCSGDSDDDDNNTSTTATVRFKITDKTEAPIKDARVEVVDVDTKTTDSGGLVIFDDLEKKNYTVKVTAEGYEPVDTEESIDKDDVTITIPMPELADDGTTDDGTPDSDTPEKINLLTNGSFETGEGDLYAPWEIYKEPHRANAYFNVKHFDSLSSNVMEVETVSTGGEPNHLQLKQNVKLAAGTYICSFKAKLKDYSTVKRRVIQAYAMDTSDNSYKGERTEYMGRDDWKEFEFEFNVEADTEQDYTIGFNLGKIPDYDNVPMLTFYIDDVRLVKVEN